MTQSLKELSIGLIGYGFAGRVFHAPLIAATDGLRLRCVVASDAARIRSDFPDAVATPDPQHLFDDPSIALVVIATPNRSHYPLARQALEAGKHLVIDKPFVVDLAEGVELQRLALQRNLLLSVFHNRRWDNDFLTVQQCVASGALGEINTYQAHFNRFVPEVDSGWRDRPEPGAGVLYDLGAHLIDQALQLFGLPQRIHADLGTQRPGAIVDDYFHLSLDYGRLKVILHASLLVRHPGPRYEVHGMRGSFVKYGIDSQEASLLAGVGPGDTAWGVDDAAWFGSLTTEVNGVVTTRTVDTVRGSYEAYYRGVHAAICTGGPNPVTAEDALNVIRVIECARRSHRDRCSVTFERERT